MSRWVDMLTRVIYEIDEETQASLVEHLAGELHCFLKARGVAIEAHRPSKRVADAVAEFWGDRYPELIYPIRLERDDPSTPASLSADVHPVRKLTGPWRSAYLGPGAPPLLPAGGLGLGVPETLLASEWALTASLFAQGAWAALAGENHSPDPEDVAALRLGLLLYPVRRALGNHRETLGALASHPRVAAVMACLEGTADTLPSPGQEIVGALRDPAAHKKLLQGCVQLLVAEAVRIKQYVFESPFLPQIRGGSILIEQAVREAAEIVTDWFGPESVLRKAGGSLVAVLPCVHPEMAEECQRRVLATCYRITGTARFAAGTASVSLSELHPGIGSRSFNEKHLKQAYGALNRMREGAEEPIWETLPFEARCDACGERAAEHETQVARETLWLCSVCAQRQAVGRNEREQQLKRVWEEVGVDPGAWIHPPEDPAKREQWSGPVPPSFNELVPEAESRRRWIAMVYGDGNNFGGIVQRLRGLADQLHWSRRLYWTVRGLTELALTEATLWFAAGRASDKAATVRRARYNYFPFEILTIGGDDVAFFAWAPVALKAVERLQTFLAREFGRAAGPGPDDWPPVTFSFGVAVADSHTPVRRLQEVAEEVLLKRVKAETPPGAPQGLIGYFVATSPADMDPKRAARLWRPEAREDGEGVLLSVQPVTAEQLTFLMDLAVQLTPDVGRLSRITAPFLAASPAVASLYYRYLRARAKARSSEAGRPSEDSFFDVLEGHRSGGKGWELFGNGASEQRRVFLLLHQRRDHPDPGRGGAERCLVPLLDLLHLVKVLQ